MTIVAYGLGLEGAVAINVALTDDVILAIADEPVITLDPGVVITLDLDG